MSQQITLDLPEEVLEPLREQADTSGRTLEATAMEWLYGSARRLKDNAPLPPTAFVKAKDSYALSLLTEAQSRYDRLPEEIKREMPDASPQEGMTTQKLAGRIEAFDLILNTAALTDDERNLLNRSLDDILAAMARLSAELQEAKEATLAGAA